MEKIFKKSLALILSAALCLTALVGCLTVSAAEGDTTKPVYSVNSVEGAAGAEVEVVAKAEQKEDGSTATPKYTEEELKEKLEAYKATKETHPDLVF